MKRPPPRAVPLTEIAGAVDGQLVGAGDPLIAGVSSLLDASDGDLAYVDHDRFIPAALASSAAAFVTSRHLRELSRPQVVVPNPRYASVRVVERFFPPARPPRGIASPIARGADVEIGPDVAIGPFVTLGDRVRVGARVSLGAGVFIGDDAVIGDDSTLYPRVTILERCEIGRRVIIHSGAVVGSDGFGYVMLDGRHHKVPQIGDVLVEDDVEIGANVAIDRATFGSTRIGRGTKIDNLVHIAHNVTIGPDGILVAQVGIAGSTRLGAHVVAGGQVGVSEHLEIGDGAMMAAQAGVARNLAPGEIVSGTPAFPHAASLRAHVLFERLPELRQQVRQLAERVRVLEAQGTTPTRKPRRRSPPS
jgi:UDP-3-O-[3-hydroxymyristoyl] glucosamine N-acyltransferase